MPFHRFNPARITISGLSAGLEQAKTQNVDFKPAQKTPIG